MKEIVLRTELLSKSFGGLRAVNGCTLGFEKHRITGLIGPNGAGKSTLFNVIAGTVRTDSGKVFLGESEVTNLRPYERYHMGLSRTFQMAHEFFGMTVLENLLVSRPDQPGEKFWNNWIRSSLSKQVERENVERGLEVLDFLRLSHLRDAMAGTLSGGQKKLLELGRVMMGDPKIVLLDEIAAGINPVLMKEIGEFIKGLNRDRGYSFCLIEHDMELIEDLCDHVIVLVRGEVLMEGSIEEVRSHEEVIESYLGGGG